MPDADDVERRGPMRAGRWPLSGRDGETARARAALADPACGGVIFVGVAGVGRSRMAEELIADVASTGRPVARAIADATTGAVPFGPLAHLLPADSMVTPAGSTFDPVQLLAEARSVLGAAKRLVLMVDDAHLLDAVSFTLLNQLVQAGEVALVLTVRTDEPQPDALHTLWRTDRLIRVDLEPLPADAVAGLLRAGLGGSVDGRTTRTLFESSGGNPLLLRELVRAAEAEGVLIEIDGMWSLVGALPTRHRAAELLHHRVSAVTGDARSVLELLAMIGPTELVALGGWFGSDVLERLEAERLVVVRQGEGVDVVALAHPLLVDTVRAATPTLRARSVLRTWANQVDASAGRTTRDVLRVAAWRLECGDAIDPAVAEATATLARHAADYALTLRLARIAHDRQPTMANATLFGEALYETGTFDEAEAVLAAADGLPGTPADVLRLVGIRGTNLLFGLLQPERALDVTDAAGARLQGDGLEAFREELVSRRANVQLYSGHPDRALRTLDDLDVRTRLSDRTSSVSNDEARTQVLWATPGVPAIALAGHSGEAIELAHLAYLRHRSLDDDIALTSPETHLLTLGLALQEHGALQEANDLAVAGYEASVGARSLMGQTWFALSLARVALIRGQGVTGVRWCREAVGVTAASHWRGPRSMALAGLAAMCALSGEMAEAHRALVDLAAIDGRFGFLLPERCLGSAWVLAAQGRRADAVEVLLGGANAARDTGHVTVECWLLYEAARVGPAVDVLVRLESVAAGCDGPLAAARALHVRSRVADSTDGLIAAADAFAAMGCHLAGAEASAHASGAARRLGDQRQATGLAGRAAEQLALAEGARSDELVALASVVPLTGREREVAVLAAGGTSSQEIGRRLFVSVRTVNNHLQNAYTKLGVSSRAELGVALARSESAPLG